MVYTIRNHCVELPQMDYDDGAVTLFLNVKGTKGNPPEDLRMLLKYLSDTRKENACTPELSQIQDEIEAIKRDSRIGRQYMNWKEYIERERSDAIEKEKKRTDSEKKRADFEKERADFEKERADSATERADKAEAEALRLRALLERNGILVENDSM